MRRIILDLFAGPGGWSHALTVLGARDVGLEPRTGSPCALPRAPRSPEGTVSVAIAFTGVGLCESERNDLVGREEFLGHMLRIGRKTGVAAASLLRSHLNWRVCGSR